MIQEFFYRQFRFKFCPFHFANISFISFSQADPPPPQKKITPPTQPLPPNELFMILKRERKEHKKLIVIREMVFEQFNSLDSFKNINIYNNASFSQFSKIKTLITFPNSKP